ncbi:hypothetical protein D1012_08525 [Pseudotabrizicola alkalilacus]|uniref:Uncharacterized protein n=1 Tax=Pseudotabrizicola alkalilacus TaxID=2305252 RepID=A0A411Z4E9_9RHOB|nr:hypothetical protein D1012_08525 [Pseudotabrizicola alkalilacus]
MAGAGATGSAGAGAAGSTGAGSAGAGATGSAGAGAIGSLGAVPSGTGLTGPPSGAVAGASMVTLLPVVGWFAGVPLPDMSQATIPTAMTAPPSRYTNQLVDLVS